MRLLQEWMDNHGGDGADVESAKSSFLEIIPEIERQYRVRILLAYVRGSHMYGLNTSTSDVDITIIYQQPMQDILMTDYLPTINFDGKNNVVGYEIQNYIHLLMKNNPNILESLDIPERCLIFKADIIQNVLDYDWVSKLTRNSILGYANSQIKKASGLNKNMNRPQPKKRKSILDFCYVIDKHESHNFVEWMKGVSDEITSVDRLIVMTMNFGIAKVQNGQGLYALYVGDEKDNMRGIIASEDSTQLRLSTIPKDVMENNFVCVFYYDGNKFEQHCKEHLNYWKWAEERNEERFKLNQKIGQGYDFKNMAHLFRILEMAEKIATTKKISVESSDIQYLINIRNGKYTYDHLIELADAKFESINLKYEESDLKTVVNNAEAKKILLKLRYDY